MKKYLLAIVLTLLSLTMLGARAQDVVPHPQDAVLGAGDGIKISVFNQPDLTVETRISDTGKITFPLIGVVQVGGLSAADAEMKIAQLLKNGKFILNPQVSINVTSMQSQQVSVLGQVTKPGRYPLEGKRNLTDMLALAGGVGVDGGEQITLIRNRDGKTTREVIDLVEIVRSSDAQANPQLIAGDVVYVERAPRFYIYGEVQKPGSYKLERNMIVLQALSTGGGLTPRGTERGIRIKRRDASGELKLYSAEPEDKVQADDIVYIKESLF